MRTRRSRRYFATLAAAGALVLGGALPAHAAVALAGPGAAVAGYATRIVATPDGTPVTFVNADVSDHTVTAADATLRRKAAKKTSYCKAYGVRSCPLFTSGVVPGGESAEVRGLGRAKPGREYEFVCQIHGSMQGTLIVLGTAAPLDR